MIAPTIVAMKSGTYKDDTHIFVLDAQETWAYNDYLVASDITDPDIVYEAPTNGNNQGLYIKMQ